MQLNNRTSRRIKLVFGAKEQENKIDCSRLWFVCVFVPLCNIHTQEPARQTSERCVRRAYKWAQQINVALLRLLLLLLIDIVIVVVDFINGLIDYLS